MSGVKGLVKEKDARCDVVEKGRAEMGEGPGAHKTKNSQTPFFNSCALRPSLGFPTVSHVQRELASLLISRPSLRPPIDAGLVALRPQNPGRKQRARKQRARKQAPGSSAPGSSAQI